MIVVLDGSHSRAISDGHINNHLTDNNSPVSVHTDIVKSGLEDELFVPTGIAVGEPVSKGLLLVAASAGLTAWVDDAGGGVGAGEAVDSVVVAGLDLGVELGLELEDGLAAVGRSAVGGLAAGRAGARARVASTVMVVVAR